MKKTLCLLLSLLFILGLAACNGSGKPSDESGAKDNSDITIGWSVYNIAYEYFISMEKGVAEKAEELGVKLIKHNQGEDATEMVTGCENMIAQGIDALVISPCKPESMTQIVAAADEAKIPVIVVDIGTGGSDYDCFIISDVYGGGQMAGEYTIKVLQAKNIARKDYAVIKCEESAVYAIQRGEGFKNVMDKAGYKFTTQITANSSQDQGYNAMKDILTAYPDVAAVYCENDKMAMGAANAIEEAGKTGDIVVMGFDGDAAALEFIKEGKMAGTIAQDPYGMGAKGVEVAVQMVRGEKVVISGFGCFRTVKRKDRKGVNPRTGDSIVIPGRKAVVFKPSKYLKSL
jgi:ribose transport system substrate-binding protein